VGSFLCSRLSEGGHDVTVVEAAGAVARVVDETSNVRVVEGNGSSAGLLVGAGVRECDCFLALTSDDQTNLVSASLAKALGAKMTVARIHDQTYTDHSIVNYQLHFGIDYLLNPEALCAVELAKAIRNPGRVALENFSRGRIEVQQVGVSPASKLVGRALVDLRLPPGVRIGCVQRGEVQEVGNRDTVLEVGDLVTLFGRAEALGEVRGRLEPERKPEAARVVLYGATEAATALVRLLNNPRFRLRVIEPDLEIGRRFAEKFPNVTVIQGEATSRRLLEEEQIGDADYFVACTKDDEDNIVTGLQASRLGAKHVQLVINRSDYEAVLDDLKEKLGVELLVSPRVATVTEVERFLMPEAVVDLARLEGDLRLLEFRVGRDAPANGSLVREVAWPRGTLVVALLHKFEARVPGPDDRVLEGDRVVTISAESRRSDLRRLLVGE